MAVSLPLSSPSSSSGTLILSPPGDSDASKHIHFVIRRIKCDEEKPACQRCISTGRTCDGYKAAAKTKTTNIRRTGVTHQLFPQDRPTSTQLTLQRPLVTDFTGDPMERHYIHRWLPIAEDVVGIQERANGFFWGSIVPEYVFASQSVRHATIALSAAHLNFQMSGCRPNFTGSLNKMECFVIKHYNLALKNINAEIYDIAAPPQKRFGIIIIACIFFFYTEILRNQWPTAMMHIINGLKLMTNLPAEIDEIYQKPEKWSKGNDDTHTRATYMLRLLCRWEVTAGFLATKNRPSMSIHVWKPTTRQTCSVPSEVVSHEHLQEIVDVFYQEVCAFIWLCKNNDREEVPWDHSAFKLQHNILQQRSYHVAKLLERYRGTFGNFERAVRATEYLKYQARCLHQRSAALCLDITPLPEGKTYAPPIEASTRFEEIMELSDGIRDTLQMTLGPGAATWFSIDFGVISALYLAATSCSDSEIRRRLFVRIKDWPWRENLWDGPLLRDHLLNGEPIETPPESPETELVFRTSPR
ncbi:Transcription regulator lscL-like protein [Cladobotryum mycophilum]|uniref:Transcription regulator lscL-like protein n=1 Tax=Cladobotryum mycophilum TaxID=491253 RepID=A0ABR0T2V1_9HYPO